MLNNKILYFDTFGAYRHILADNFGSVKFAFGIFRCI